MCRRQCKDGCLPERGGCWTVDGPACGCGRAGGRGDGDVAALRCQSLESVVLLMVRLVMIRRWIGDNWV